jgi:hypothetical protein
MAVRMAAMEVPAEMTARAEYQVLVVSATMAH